MYGWAIFGVLQELIFVIGKTFSCWEWIFAIFRKFPSTVFGIVTFSFFEYKQLNTGEQHADV